MEKDIPFFEDLNDMFDYLKLPSSQNPDVWVEKVDMGWPHSDLRVPPFQHTFYVINFFLEGEGTIKVGEWKQNMVFPSVFILPPGLMVSCDFEIAHVKKYSLVLTKRYIEKHSQLRNIIFSYPYYRAEKTKPLNLELKDSASITSIFEVLLEEYNANENLDIVAGYINVLLLKIDKLYGKQTKLDDFNVYDNLVKRFLALVQQDSKNLEIVDNNVSCIATKLGVHPNYLSTVVKRETGKTPKEYLDAKLINNAKTFLLQTEFSIKEIAFRLNFKEAAHFVNFFKKQTSVTPVQYRNDVYAK